LYGILRSHSSLSPCLVGSCSLLGLSTGSGIATDRGNHRLLLPETISLIVDSTTTSDLAQSHQVTEINPNVTPDSLPLVCPEPIPTMPVCVGLSQNMSIAADPHMMTQPLTLCDGVSDSPCNCCDPQTCTLLNGDVPYMTEVSSLGCRLCDLEVNAGENGYHNQYEAPEKVAYPVDPPKQQR
jgi:hypothetical protein